MGVFVVFSHHSLLAKILLLTGRSILTPYLIWLTWTFYQSEHKHQTSKGCFLWTSGQPILQQLARIEQRQQSIHTIHENLNLSPSQIQAENIAANPGAHYNMEMSQKFPLHIPTFLQQNQGDPAVTVSNFSSNSTYLSCF